MGYDLTKPVTREKQRAYQRAWRAKNAATFKAKARARHLIKTYGMTLQDEADLICKQDGNCAACQRELGERYAIDHDHRTGLVRALLCTQCNTALGMVDDSIEKLTNLIKYLQSFAS